MKKICTAVLLMAATGVTFAADFAPVKKQQGYEACVYASKGKYVVNEYDVAVNAGGKVVHVKLNGETLPTEVKGEHQSKDGSLKISYVPIGKPEKNMGTLSGTYKGEKITSIPVTVACSEH
ncbi:hypothetical protein [Crenobacter intestini]|uniref:Lysozyme inhibitor n=1 Tax=Crenobacter intestini TaxID=2563443 RepID=A0A4T0UNX0_9NEIS|nr:hypothetical protein [Crenobacter intestini]TIC80307.1 hypothetical protein E5K04_12435 [Crenobacter intestini]